jgi:hypothetical protein
MLSCTKLRFNQSRPVAATLHPVSGKVWAAVTQQLRMSVKVQRCHRAVVCTCWERRQPLHIKPVAA